jgi:aminopeptidase N
MKKLVTFLGMLIFLFPVPFSCKAKDLQGTGTPVHHDIRVRLYPGEHRLEAEDTVTLPEDAPSEIGIYIHKGLGPFTSSQGVYLSRNGEEKFGVPVESFTVKLPAGVHKFVLGYGGVIDHPLEPVGKEQARGFSDTPGTISDKGVFLSGSSFWYPALDGGFITFTVKVELPSGWDAVSQGGRTLHEKEETGTEVIWESPEPQEGIYLVAARFTEYTRPAGKILAMVFLRTPDPGLAEKYLDATARYIDMYDGLIGPYPYGKFALVENFWETGFGMPSFTLLGPTVIRLPFIINSSYPHEILHNWWGNSVYPDYTSGNWSEGLTAYLSDHLIKEQQGNGAEYRLSVLQKYADYVLSGRDFPLTGFRSRHSSPSEAIGYGKSLMFFHMLRRELGDEIFKEGLRDFYRSNRFRVAGFDDLEKSFEKVSGKDLGAEFDQWIKREGAPKLKISEAKVVKDKEGFILRVVLDQVQRGDVYQLRVPFAVTLEGLDGAYQSVAVMKEKRSEFSLELPERPLRLDVDPEYDVFRRLDREEIPPGVSQALGAKKMLVVLPSAAGEAMLRGYRDLAVSLGNSGPDEVEIKSDKDISKLPTDRAVAILGWKNGFLKEVADSLSGNDVSIGEENVRVANTVYPRSDHSFVLAARNPAVPDNAIIFIASSRTEALPGLGRKLPHYHKYSYLVFQGNAPENVAKGRWLVVDSPMTVFFPGGGKSKVKMEPLAPRKPLVPISSVFSEERMMETVRFLASDDMKGRGIGTPELDRAAEYIAGKFSDAGLRPGGYNGSYFQSWEERGDDGQVVAMKNVIGVMPGTEPALSGQSIVVGAHYDHLGRGGPNVKKVNIGKIHSGSDDNASGVAVLVELARVMGKSLEPARSIVFAAFTGEETGKKGSKFYVDYEKQYPAGKCIGMVNLDTVGRLGQKNLLVLGTGSAEEWGHILRGAGYVTGVGIETVSEELDSSDQMSFQEAGVPSVQLFTGPHLDYHTPTDTPDRVDAGGLVKVALVAKEVVEYLSSRKGPLTLTTKWGSGKSAGPKGPRKVSLGTVPDFTFSGEGCRISGVVPGSPAETCGLQEGDIITRINEQRIRGLKDLSEVLKSLSPGDPISVTLLREGRELTVESEVKER